MDEQNTNQANLSGQSVTEFSALEPSALERRMRRLMGGTSTVQRRHTRIDWRHNSAKDPVLSRIWVAEK